MTAYAQKDLEDWKKNNIELLKKEFLRDMEEQFNDFCSFYFESRVLGTERCDRWI